MSTEPQRTCPSCGNELPGAMEFCPVCLLRKGLTGGVESGVSSFGDTLKPTPGEADRRFQHYELVTGEDGKPVELGRGAKVRNEIFRGAASPAGASQLLLIRLFQQRPRYWLALRNWHNIWLSRSDKLKQPDKHKSTKV